MTDRFADSQEEKSVNELRKTADNVYAYIKNWSRSEEITEEAEDSDQKLQKRPSKDSLEKIIDAEIGTDLKKLKEKLLILLIDNYKLREKNTLLSYESELSKEELHETALDLKRLSAFWKAKRRELTFLKRVTQQQETEIAALLKAISKMKEKQVRRMEEKGVKPLRGPCSRGGNLEMTVESSDISD